MTELHIRIDQDSGAILGVRQVYDGRRNSDNLDASGNIYTGKTGTVGDLKEWRDTFDRIVTIPLELWEKKDGSVCTINAGGNIYRCQH